MSTDPHSLPFWLGVPVALLLLLVPGFVTHNLILTLGKAKQAPATTNGTALSLTERIFWTLALSVAVVGWTAFVLAELGLYSIGWLFGVMAVYSSAAIFFLYRRTANINTSKITASSQYKYKFGLQINRKNLDGAALTALLLLTVGLFCWRTHETIVGGQDSGTYYDTGINIAQTGSIMIHDPLLPTFSTSGPFASIAGKLQSQLLQGMPGEVDRFLFVSHQRLPAYFVNDNEQGLQTGEAVPQFFHFYPVLIAIAYSLFGLFGGLYVTPLLAVLAVFAVYLTGRRLFPAPRQRWIGLLGAALLALNPAQVWFVRETLWETVGQFLIFTGLYAITLYARPYPLTEGETENPEQRDNGAARLGAFGAGVAFGLVTLAHSQFPFIIAPLFPLLVYLRLSRRWSREVWWLAIPFGLLLLHTTIHTRAFALGYFEGIYHHILQFFGDTILIWAALLTLLLVALIIIDAMPTRLLRIEKWLVARWSWVSVGVAVIVVGYLTYSYFVRVYQIKLDWHESEPVHYFSLQSYIGAPTTAGKERNLLRLGWYLSPLGIGLVLVGAASLCWKRLNARSAMFLSVAAILSLLFLDQNYTLEHFIYSLRRYVPVTFPAFSLIMAYALLEVLPQIGDWLYGRIKGFGLRRQRQLVTSGSNGASAIMAMPGVAFLVTQNSPKTQPLQTSEALPTAGVKKNNWGYQAGKWAGYVGALALMVFFVFTGLTIYRLQQYDGVTQQLENLAQEFGPRDIVIFSGEPATDSKIAVPLNYVFDHQTFVLTRAPKNDLLGQVFSYWQKQGYHIKAMLGNNGGRFAPDGFDLIPMGNFKLTLTQLQDSDKQKPKNIETNSLDYGIYDVQNHAGAAGTLGYGVTQPDGWTLHAGNDDYPALIDGFYPVEHETSVDPTNPANSVYRWTDGDAGHHPILRLPCLAAGRNQLSLTLGPGLNPKPITLKIYLSNQWYDDPTDPKSPLKQVAGTIQLAPGSDPKTYTIDVPQNLPQTDCANGSLILHLVMTDPKAAFVPLNLNQGSNDARLLGYKFYQVALGRQP